MECICYPGKPYGDYLWDTDHVTMGHVYETDDGRVEHIQVDLKQALTRKRRLYEKWKSKKMPKGLARLIATMEDKSDQKVQS